MSLQKLIANFDDEQIEILSGIALRMAAGKAERYTGQINFQVNMHMGGLGDMGVSRNEIVRLQKKRGVRSGGM
jgi:hypothetical protein